MTPYALGLTHGCIGTALAVCVTIVLSFAIARLFFGGRG